MNIMVTLMIMMSLFLLIMNHPLSMGFILIIQTIITAMVIGYLMKSFLFSYIIIIIMLSGALVLFIYMASVASNEKFKFPIIYSAMNIIMSLMIFIYLKYNNNNWELNNLQMNEKISLIKIFNTLNFTITIMMITYLLLTMIAVSNIAKVTEGPLRMSSNSK
uniref:NADH dehydrogenase subunit 6 n=1 Tax=Anaxilaus musgravei TaxID=2893314 RepID=UPI001FA704F5|nr:NADH dehydrogenase subunit 6 [Anaxilaus musgravei]QUT09476.1 NADH dehydrogenase subunit 6 [Anaxilaus musgravei]